MSSSSPLLSVIVPTRNRARYLERSLRSILAELEHDCPNSELIVIDGGSTDGTVELLKQYGDRISYWVSEKDSGVSDAANKGLARARGEYIRFLGDDDELLPGKTRELIAYLDANPTVDVVIGYPAFFTQYADGTLEPCPLPQPPPGPMGYREMLEVTRSSGYPTPETSLSRRRVFEQHGNYDTSFHYFAYLDIWIRHARAGVRFQVVPITVANRYLTPATDSIKGQKLIPAEWRRLMRAHADLRWWITCGLEHFARDYFWHPFVRTCQRWHIRPKRLLRTLRARPAAAGR